MNLPLASVVIPTYRRPALLGRCLAALLEQDLPAEGFEIIVVDDDPAGSARDVVGAWGDVASERGLSIRYTTTTRSHGPAAARNAGWRQASGPVIAFTDDDCIPERSWLSTGLAVMGHEGLDGAAGRIIVPRPAVPTDYEKTMAGLEASAFATANCFYRKDALQRVGGFNEAFTMAWREDSDLHFRLLQSGAQLSRADDAVVVHPVRPAPWGISLREQRKAMFNSLVYRTSPTLYRRHIQARPPLKYYTTVGAAGLATSAVLLGNRRAAAVGIAAWTILTLEFTVRRLRGTKKSTGHVLEMGVTSALIPPLAVYWRLRGAIRHRILFL